MKISKLILACILGGMVGNVFAEPVVIACKFDDKKIASIEVEFDDNIPNQLAVGGRSLPYSYVGYGYTKNNAELIELNTATISWSKEHQANGVNFSFFYQINRKTGRITYEHKSMNLHNIYRGTCTKMANNGF